MYAAFSRAYMVAKNDAKVKACKNQNALAAEEKGGQDTLSSRKIGFASIIETPQTYHSQRRGDDSTVESRGSEKVKEHTMKMPIINLTHLRADTSACVQ